MYPAYTREATLQEYAVTFFTLLNEGYRQKTRDLMAYAEIFMLPMMTPETRREIIKRLEWAAKDPSDILKSGEEASSTGDLKKFLERV